MRITFITRSAWPGVYWAMRYCSNALREVGHEVELKELPFDQRQAIMLLEECRANNSDNIVFGGYDQVIRGFIHNLSSSGKNVSVYWCSPLSQIELSGDEIYWYADIIGLANQGIISNIFTTYKHDEQVMKKFCGAFQWWPVVLDLGTLDVQHKDVALDKNFTHLDLFCAPNPRKNLLVSLFSGVNLDSTKIHVNYEDNHMYSKTYNFALQILQCKDSIVNHRWLDRGTYLSYVKNMDFAIQCTMSESYNSSVAEHFYYGVPVVISNQVCCARDFYSGIMLDDELQKYLVVEDLQNGSDILEKCNSLASNKNLRNELGAKCREHIVKQTKCIKEYVQNVLPNILEKI